MILSDRNQSTSVEVLYRSVFLRTGQRSSSRSSRLTTCLNQNLNGGDVQWVWVIFSLGLLGCLGTCESGRSPGTAPATKPMAPEACLCCRFVRIIPTTLQPITSPVFITGGPDRLVTSYQDCLTRPNLASPTKQDAEDLTQTQGR